MAGMSRADQEALYGRLIELNERCGSPADEATEMVNKVGDMFALADELKGRIETSYNSSHVERRLKGLMPKVCALALCCVWCIVVFGACRTVVKLALGPTVAPRSLFA